jgi:hypothetical protein
MNNKCFGIFLFVTLSFISSEAQVITTIAGDSIRGYSGDNGPATAAELSYPEAVALDTTGNVYIVDNGNARIREINISSGSITTVAGNGMGGFSGDGGPATAAELGAIGIYIDKKNNIYIADEGNSRVRKVDGITKIITTIAGNGTSTYGSGVGGPATAAGVYPSAVYADDSGNVYIADGYGVDLIQKVSAITGIITTIAGDGTIGHYAGDGGPATAAEFDTPEGLFGDSVGNIYIADAGNDRIRKITMTTGIINTIVGNGAQGFGGDGGQATNAELYNPSAVVIDATGNIYIADNSNNRIRKVNVSSGIITTVAGDNLKGFSGDGGMATAAELNVPYSVCVNRLGDFYIADDQNSRIRRVSIPAGINELNNGSGEVVVYPNPSNGVFQLKITNYELRINDNVEVYNVLGKKVYSGIANSHGPLANSQITINLNNQPTGIYLYRILNDKSECISSGKLIIQ